MLGAKHIVVINTDADAPIIGHADHALIGDLKEVIPALVEASGPGTARPDMTVDEMPKPDLESSLPVSAPRELGVTVIVQPWEEPLDWAAAPPVVVRTPWKIEPGLSLTEIPAHRPLAKHIEALLPSRSPRR